MRTLFILTALTACSPAHEAVEALVEDAEPAPIPAVDCGFGHLILRADEGPEVLLTLNGDTATLSHWDDAHCARLQDEGRFAPDCSLEVEHRCGEVTRRYTVDVEAGTAALDDTVLGAEEVDSFHPSCARAPETEHSPDYYFDDGGDRLLDLEGRVTGAVRVVARTDASVRVRGADFELDLPIADLDAPLGALWLDAERRALGHGAGSSFVLRAGDAEGAILRAALDAPSVGGPIDDAGLMGEVLGGCEAAWVIGVCGVVEQPAMLAFPEGRVGSGESLSLASGLKVHVAHAALYPASECPGYTPEAWFSIVWM